MMPDQSPAFAVREQVLPTDHANNFLSSVLNYSLVNVMNGRESRIGLCRQVSISCWLISQRNSHRRAPYRSVRGNFLGERWDRRFSHLSSVGILSGGGFLVAFQFITILVDAHWVIIKRGDECFLMPVDLNDRNSRGIGRA